MRLAALRCTGVSPRVVGTKRRQSVHFCAVELRAPLTADLAARPCRSRAGRMAGWAGHAAGRPKPRCNKGCELCGSPRRVRSPSSADAVAVVMTRRHLQAPAALEHQPAQAGPRHAAEACLSCMAGAAHAHRHDLCAGAQPNRRRGRCCRRRPADAAFHRQQHHHQKRLGQGQASWRAGARPVHPCAPPRCSMLLERPRPTSGRGATASLCCVALYVRWIHLVPSPTSFRAVTEAFEGPNTAKPNNRIHTTRGTTLHK